MEKAYNISVLRFEKGYMLLVADSQVIKLKLKESTQLELLKKCFSIFECDCIIQKHVDELYE